jgi:hypothetical protein
MKFVSVRGCGSNRTCHQNGPASCKRGGVVPSIGPASRKRGRNTTPNRCCIMVNCTIDVFRCVSLCQTTVCQNDTPRLTSGRGLLTARPTRSPCSTAHLKTDTCPVETHAKHIFADPVFARVCSSLLAARSSARRRAAAATCRQPSRPRPPAAALGADEHGVTVSVWTI